MHCCFMDSSEANDSAPRRFLREALACLGVGARFLLALRSLYHDSTFAVLAGGCVGKFLSSLAGLTPS